MTRVRRLPMSKEEKVAIKIGNLISDFSLDIEAVGKYLALSNNLVAYRRVIEVLEATEYNKTVSEYRETGKYYAQHLFE